MAMPYPFTFITSLASNGLMLSLPCFYLLYLIITSIFVIYHIFIPIQFDITISERWFLVYVVWLL